MISIERSFTSCYTLVTTILIYKTFVLSSIFLSPSGVQHTTRWVVCSTPHVLSPNAFIPHILIPRALSPNGLRNVLQNQALQR